MRSKNRLGQVLALVSLSLGFLSAEPSEFREWTAKSGHKLEGKALQVAGGKVQLERADGTKIAVEMDKLSDEDRDFLVDHFSIEEEQPASAEAPPEGEVADDLSHPLGEIIENIQATDEWSYMLYLPKSLRKGEKHPVLYIMDPGGGKTGAVRKYMDGAERNGWILAHSKQSKNGFARSQDAVDAMIEHVTKELPIDEERMYTTGFSGGSRMAFATSQIHKEIAGVIPCGAGGSLGSSKQTAYGVCGTNCYNRTDMSNSFKGIKGEDSMLRFFPGKHSWASNELFDDAITHLNGVFLIKNDEDYPEAYARHIHQVMELIREEQESNPMRAIMWSDFLTKRDIETAGLAEIHAELSGDSVNLLYLKGLGGVDDFAIDTFGNNPGSAWKIDAKDSKDCLDESAKYAGTPWAEILELMSKDAQEF